MNALLLILALSIVVTYGFRLMNRLEGFLSSDKTFGDKRSARE